MTNSAYVDVMTNLESRHLFFSYSKFEYFFVLHILFSLLLPLDYRPSFYAEKKTMKAKI
jgi:hypothetical protein